MHEIQETQQLIWNLIQSAHIYWEIRNTIKPSETSKRFNKNNFKTFEIKSIHLFFIALERKRWQNCRQIF